MNFKVISGLMAIIVCCLFSLCGCSNDAKEMQPSISTSKTITLKTSINSFFEKEELTRGVRVPAGLKSHFLENDEVAVLLKKGASMEKLVQKYQNGKWLPEIIDDNREITEITAIYPVPNNFMTNNALSFAGNVSDCTMETIPLVAHTLVAQDENQVSLAFKPALSIISVQWLDEKNNTNLSDISIKAKTNYNIESSTDVKASSEEHYLRPVLSEGNISYFILPSQVIAQTDKDENKLLKIVVANKTQYWQSQAINIPQACILPVAIKAVYNASEDKTVDVTIGTAEGYANLSALRSNLLPSKLKYPSTLILNNNGVFKRFVLPDDYTKWNDVVPASEVSDKTKMTLVYPRLLPFNFRSDNAQIGFLKEYSEGKKIFETESLGESYRPAEIFNEMVRRALTGKYAITFYTTDHAMNMWGAHFDSKGLVDKIYIVDNNDFFFTEKFGEVGLLEVNVIQKDNKVYLRNYDLRGADHVLSRITLLPLDFQPEK